LILTFFSSMRAWFLPIDTMRCPSFRDISSDFHFSSLFRLL
jgi:hypothetical protein